LTFITFLLFHRFYMDFCFQFFIFRDCISASTTEKHPRHPGALLLFRYFLSFSSNAEFYTIPQPKIRLFSWLKFPATLIYCLPLCSLFKFSLHPSFVSILRRRISAIQVGDRFPPLYLFQLCLFEKFSPVQRSFRLRLSSESYLSFQEKHPPSPHASPFVPLSSLSPQDIPLSFRH